MKKFVLLTLIFITILSSIILLSNSSNRHNEIIIANQYKFKYAPLQIMKSKGLFEKK